jgi:hypothetical protein
VTLRPVVVGSTSAGWGGNVGVQRQNEQSVLGSGVLRILKIEKSKNFKKNRKLKKIKSKLEH